MSRVDDANLEQVTRVLLTLLVQNGGSVDLPLDLVNSEEIANTRADAVASADGKTLHVRVLPVIAN